MIIPVINLINLLFQIFSFMILLDVIGSWLLVARVRLPDWAYTILSTIRRFTAPVLNPIRRLIPGLGGLDLSPLIALFLLDFIRRLVVGALYTVR